VVASALLSSATDEWATPPDFFAKVEAEFGPFDLDPCATAENAKAPQFYTREQDGLTQPWGRNNFVNPPYSALREWLEKGYSEARERGNASTFLVPARTDTQGFHRFVFPFAGINAAGFEWAAGIIDGEGCIFVRKNLPTETSKHRSPIHDLGVKVTMTHQPTVERLAALFGVGHLTTDSKKPAGCKTSYSWTCYGGDAAHVLERVYPHLLTKRHEALLGLEFSLLKSARKGRARVPQDLLDLRERYYIDLQAIKRSAPDFYAPNVEIRFIKGRLKFGGAKNSAPFPSALVVFRRPGV
jgi:hypothetical protein